MKYPRIIREKIGQYQKVHPENCKIGKIANFLRKFKICGKWRNSSEQLKNSKNKISKKKS